MSNKIELNLDEIKQLYIEKKYTIKKIAEIMNCGRSTIQSRINEMGLNKNKKTTRTTNEDIETFKDEIKRLYLEEHLSSDRIGKKFGKTGGCILYHLKNMGITGKDFKKAKESDTNKTSEYKELNPNYVYNYINKEKSSLEYKIPYLTKQFILGSLLGDLSIRKEGVNASLCIVHSRKQEDLFFEKIKLLGNLLGSYRLYNSAVDKRTGKIYETLRGNTVVNRELTELYNILYINNVKTITEEYLSLIEDPIALAYWFMDDGTERGTIATHCFSEPEVELLINWMDSKWNIKCSKQKNQTHFTLYISNRSRYKFEKLIYKYIIPSMQYKLQFLEKLKAESV